MWGGKEKRRKRGREIHVGKKEKGGGREERKEREGDRREGGKKMKRDTHVEVAGMLFMGCFFCNA